MAVAAMVTGKSRNIRDVSLLLHSSYRIESLTNDTLVTFSELWGIQIVWLAQVYQKFGYVSTYGNGKHKSGADPERS